MSSCTCKRLRRIGLAAIAFSHTVASGEPLLDEPVLFESLTAFPDSQNDTLYYLLPSPAKIASKSGQPKIQLSLTYYTGSELRDDADRDDARWLLSVGLSRAPHSQSSRQRFSDFLANSTSRKVVLRDLPLNRTPVEILFAPIHTDEKTDVGVGHVNESDATRNSAWTTRTINIALDRDDGTIFRAALEGQGATMDIGYSYFARGLVKDDVSTELDNVLSTEEDYVEITRQVFSDAFRVELDTSKYPDYLRVYDLDSVAPPGYPGLTIICSDYLVDASDWPSEETEIVVEAEGVTGTPIRTVARFPGADPENSLQYAQFKYAVRVDRPYRYMVRVYGVDGNEYESDWQSNADWYEPMYVDARSLLPVQ